MGGHHHHGGGGRGFRGGYPYGWGVPIIVENYYEDDDYPIGKTLRFNLGPPPAAPAAPVNPPTTVSNTPVAPDETPSPAAPATQTVVQSVAVPSTPPKGSLLPAGGALAGGAAGFMIAGPIGAAIGFAAGYIGGKTIAEKKAPPATATVVVPAATVHGDSDWDCCAGWAPHGDERMR